MKNKHMKSGRGKTESEVLIYGKHPAEAAIANPGRNIKNIAVTAENAAEVKALLKQYGRGNIPVTVVERREIDRMLSGDAVHQGIVLTAEMLPPVPLEEICDEARKNGSSRVLILDQVTDPQNVGAIIRSCAAFGASALVMQDKNSPAESGAMIKASAGTIELLPVCRVTNLSRAIDLLKQADFWVAGMDGYAEVTLDKLNKKGNIALVMGSEGKGMRRLVEENCDQTVKLPIDPRVESLNVSTAAAIALYELSRK